MYYVIQVKTGKEEQTMEDIRHLGKDDPYFDVFSPYKEVYRKYGGERRKVKERCFPGYLFVETNDVDRLFRELYELEAFTRLLGREGKTNHFAPLLEKEERMINILYGREQDRTSKILDIEVLKEGDRVRVLDGPLMDMEFPVKKVDLHRRRILLDLSLAGRDTKVEVGINIVMKVDG